LSESTINHLSEFSFFTPNSLRRKLLWFIKLRWFASIGAFVYGLVLSYFFSETAQLSSLLICASLLLSFNIIFALFARLNEPTSIEREKYFLFVQIFADMCLLTAIIHFSGGIENPLYFFFVFYIIITSIVTDRPSLPFIVAGIDCVLFTFMTIGEHVGWIQHYHLALISHEITIMIFAMLIFYTTIFVSAYISISLIARHRKVKNLILEQNKKLEESSVEKMKFFRFVSHELKSPIVAIESTANVITDVMADKIDNKVKNLMERIQSRTQQMLSMIKDLLDISYNQLSDDKGELVNPCEFLKSFIENERPLAEANNISLTIDICSKKANLLLDKFKLEKIFSNIFGNAIRYTPEGGTVTVTTDIINSNWILNITDSGIGIALEDQNQIFDEFFRAKNAKDHVSIGTGLGLNIVQKFVAEINGSIEIQSELNQGTIVIIKVPVHE